MSVMFHDSENQFNTYDESDCFIDLRDLKHRIDEATRLSFVEAREQVVVLRWYYLSPYRIRYLPRDP